METHDKILPLRNSTLRFVKGAVPYIVLEIVSLSILFLTEISHFRCIASKEACFPSSAGLPVFVYHVLNDAFRRMPTIEIVSVSDSVCWYRVEVDSGSIPTTNLAANRASRKTPAPGAFLFLFLCLPPSTFLVFAALFFLSMFFL